MLENACYKNTFIDSIIKRNLTSSEQLNSPCTDGYRQNVINFRGFIDCKDASVHEELGYGIWIILSRRRTMVKSAAKVYQLRDAI